MAKQKIIHSRKIPTNEKKKMDSYFCFSESPGGAEEDEDHSEDNDSSICASEKVRITEKVKKLFAHKLEKL